MYKRTIDLPLAGTIELGNVVMENRGPIVRRTMVHATIPLTRADRFRLGDPVSVLNTGTGQAERAQVERWAYPHADVGQGEFESCVRLTYPAQIPAGELRMVHQVRKTEEGVAPAFTIRPNVQAVLAGLRVVFFAGPKADWFVEVPLGGPGEVVANGLRSVVTRYYARIFQPPHAPTLRTGWGIEIDVEIFSDSDTFKLWPRVFWGDPRVDASSEDRSGLAPTDREVGLWIYGPSQTALQPIVFHPSQYQRRMTWDAGNGRWEWIFQGQEISPARSTNPVRPAVDLNDRIPWGSQFGCECVIACQGSGSLDGGGIRDQTIDSYRSAPIGNPGLCDQWRTKREAWDGLPGRMNRPFKACEHFDFTQGRNFDYVRARLEAQAQNVYNTFSFYEWNWCLRFALHPQTEWGPYASAAGDDSIYNDFQVGIPLTYLVPGFAHYLERGYMTFARHFHFREADGRPVRAINHPQLYYAIGGPEVNRSPDKLGHSQGLNAEFSIHELRDDWSGEGCTSPKWTHYENLGIFHTCLVFGNRGVQRLALQLLLHNQGSYPRLPDRLGDCGADRGWGRAMMMCIWASRVVGHLEPYTLDFLRLHICDHYMDAARQQVDAAYPGRVIRSIYYTFDQGAGGIVNNGQGNLPYWNPWMSALHIYAARIIAKFLEDRDPVRSQIFARHADDYVHDVLERGMPIETDHTTGVVQWKLEPQYSIYDWSWALSWLNGQVLNRDQWRFNRRWRDANGVCSGLGGQEYINCTITCFCNNSGASAWMPPLALDAWYGEKSDLPYLQRAIAISANEANRERPNNINYDVFIWLTKNYKFPIASRERDWITPGRETSRGTYSNGSASGMCASRLNVGDVWVTRSGANQIDRVTVASGAVQATVAVSAPAPVDGWSDVCAMTVGGQRLLALLDGANPAGTRTVYRVVVVAEANPTVAILDMPFVLSAPRTRPLYGIAWDVRGSRWLLSDGAPSNAGGWWHALFPSLTGGVATRYLGISTEDDQESLCCDIDLDGWMLARATDVGGVHLYGRGREWGCIQQRWAPANLGSLVCFSPHGREDDAQRIYCYDGASFVEVAV